MSQKILLGLFLVSLAINFVVGGAYLADKQRIISNTTFWEGCEVKDYLAELGTCTVKDLGISFAYPLEYNIFFEPTYEGPIKEVFLEYPGSDLEVPEGIDIAIEDQTLTDIVRQNDGKHSLIAEPDTTIAGVTWKVYRDNYVEHPMAPNPRQQISYFTEKNNKTYSIVASLDPTGCISEDAAKTNLDSFFASFKFL